MKTLWLIMFVINGGLTQEDKSVIGKVKNTISVSLYLK